MQSFDCVADHTRENFQEENIFGRYKTRQMHAEFINKTGLNLYGT